MAHEAIPGLMGLSGYALVAGICCLLFVEEVGVPMPFAPGDLLLVIAGASISTARLNPILVLLATYVAVVAGALAGRELFHRVGGRAVSKIARFLRVDDSVDRLAARLRRWGSCGVFLGRITPGLRVHTTEVSGLIAMPRLAFLKGLAPAVAVYEAIFSGLGSWLGLTAWGTVHQYLPTAWKLVVIVVLGLGLAWLVQIGRSRRRRSTRVHRRLVAGIAGQSNAAPRSSIAVDHAATSSAVWAHVDFVAREAGPIPDVDSALLVVVVSSGPETRAVPALASNPHIK
jgi:membrane-associated protein